MKLRHLIQYAFILTCLMTLINRTVAQFTYPLHVDSGRNLLSIPVKNEGTPISIFQQYPYPSSDAYIYDGGWQTVSIVYFGQGFYMSFSDSGTYYLTGDFIERDTFYLNAGWHLIGSISVPVPVKYIQSEPPGMITDFIRDIPKGVIDTADTIKPGLGYWVKVLQSGKIILSSTGTEVCESGQPSTYSLSQNYPNPFNPSTDVSFVISHSSFVTLKVYDVLGREIAVLVNERKQPGEYKITWNAYDMPSGVYFYRIVSGEFIDTKKMVLIR